MNSVLYILLRRFSKSEVSPTTYVGLCSLTNGRMDKQTNELSDGHMYERAHGLSSGRTNYRKGAWTIEWMKELSNGRTDEQTEEQTNGQTVSPLLPTSHKKSDRVNMVPVTPQLVPPSWYTPLYTTGAPVT